MKNDWKEKMQELYPKACRRWDDETDADTGRLFHFFDAYSLYCVVQVDPQTRGYFTGYVFAPEADQYFWVKDDTGFAVFHSRVNCEQAVFERAFALLEEKLKKGKD